MANYYNSTFRIKDKPKVYKARKPIAKCSTIVSKRVKLRKVSKTPISRLKKKLWQLCRAIIIKRYGSDCYTCPSRQLVGSNLHVGHFISSSVCSAELRYDVGNLRPQCFACNIHRSGNWPAYESHLKRDGIDVEALKARNEATKGMKADTVFYEAKIAEYEALLHSLGKEE